MQEQLIHKIQELYKNHFGKYPENIEKLPVSGSARQYFRLRRTQQEDIIAAYNEDIKENKAFLYMSKHFAEKEINVPQIYAVNDSQTIYLQEDLGDCTLFQKLEQLRTNEKDFPVEILPYYQKTIEELVKIQVLGHKNFDYSRCYPRPAFDKQSIFWDLNYFKYNFLKLSGIVFDEQALEDDFHKFSDLLTETDSDFFLFRDFQSRNIMLKEEQVYLIDYQGGRKGSCFYDLVSLLYDAKARIPLEIKKILKEHYIRSLKKYRAIKTEKFDTFFYAFALIRLLQAAGAYGFRGLYERKQHFIDSIPYAMRHIEGLMQQFTELHRFPELQRVLALLTKHPPFQKETNEYEYLTVSVRSFSYRKGIPQDNGGNGGGFVFDCRFIENPGRQEAYKSLTGKDPEVRSFLENLETGQSFFSSVKQILNAAVQEYQARNFRKLSVCFGCTGGRHRSVFFAEKTAAWLKKMPKIKVEITHNEGY